MDHQEHRFQKYKAQHLIKLRHRRERKNKLTRRHTSPAFGTESQLFEMEPVETSQRLEKVDEKDEISQSAQPLHEGEHTEV